MIRMNAGPVVKILCIVSDLANRVCPVVATILERLWQKGKVERYPIVVGVLIVVEAVVERVSSRHEHTSCWRAAAWYATVRSGLDCSSPGKEAAASEVTSDGGADRRLTI